MIKIGRLFILFAVIFTLLVFVSTANAFIWIEGEHGDAGGLLNTAQTIYGNGTVDIIRGWIAGAPAIDMYKIWLSGGETFSATVTSAPFDTQLFLFDSGGLGVYANDNISVNNPLSQLPSGNIYTPDDEGIYYLAIARYNRDPRNSGGRIFKNLPRIAVHNADGLGGSLPITGWTVNTDDETGRYNISLTGAYGIPEPATMSLLGLGLFGLASLRRRKLGRKS